MIRFRRGTALLNKVVKNFEKAVADLDAAHEHISSKRVKLQAQRDAAAAKFNAEIEKSYEQDSTLAEAQYRANVVRQNIAALVGA